MPSRDDITRESEARLGASLKDKWRLETLLGVGGMGAVYLGVHRNGKRVAIKVLHAHLTADNAVRSRFLREGYIANAIHHPAVIGVDDDDVDGDTAFLVAELVEGQTLEQRRQRAGGTLEPEVVVPVIAELLDVLVVAHAAEIVHRDLKPENLMLVNGGRLKVLDFGLARARDLMTHEADLTEPGTVLGTPHFAAPEQAAGRWNLVDAQTDLWAVGATMHRLLTGHHVHEGTSSREVLTRAATEPADSLASRLPDAPVAIVQFVDRALAFAKADRFADAQQMLEALHLVAAEMGLPLPELAVTSEVAADAEVVSDLESADTVIDSALGSRVPVHREPVSMTAGQPRWRGLWPALIIAGAIALTAVSLRRPDAGASAPAAAPTPTEIPKSAKMPSPAELPSPAEPTEQGGEGDSPVPKPPVAPETRPSPSVTTKTRPIVRAGARPDAVAATPSASSSAPPASPSVSSTGNPLNRRK